MTTTSRWAPEKYKFLLFKENYNITGNKRV
jgi:hypothetical protein